MWAGCEDGVVPRPAAPELLVLWDVDHTLIENGGVSKATYLLAYELLTGQRATVPPETDGRTDVAIMKSLLEDNGSDPADFPSERRWGPSLSRANETGAVWSGCCQNCCQRQHGEASGRYVARTPYRKRPSRPCVGVAIAPG
jgi:hypothetical protein